jgi:hypothetical protein
MVFVSSEKRNIGNPNKGRFWGRCAFFVGAGAEHEHILKTDLHISMGRK